MSRDADDRVDASRRSGGRTTVTWQKSVTFAVPQIFVPGEGSVEHVSVCSRPSSRERRRRSSAHHFFLFSATIMLARRLLLAASSRPLAYRSASLSTGTKKRQRRRSLPDDGVQLSHFISGADAKADTGTDQDELSTGPVPMPADLDSSTNHLDHLRGQVLNAEEEKPSQPQPQPQPPRTLKFHLKTYGCQMNVNDSD